MENKILSFKLLILYKNCFSTSVQAFFCPCYCKLQSFDKHQRTKNALQIDLRQQTELPHPLLRSSSSKTTPIVREQRYTRIKYTCKVVHPQKIKSFGRGQNTPLWRPPSVKETCVKLYQKQFINKGTRSMTIFFLKHHL